MTYSGTIPAISKKAFKDRSQFMHLGQDLKRGPLETKKCIGHSTLNFEQFSSLNYNLYIDAEHGLEKRKIKEKIKRNIKCLSWLLEVTEKTHSKVKEENYTKHK